MSYYLLFLYLKDSTNNNKNQTFNLFISLIIKQLTNKIQLINTT